MVGAACGGLVPGGPPGGTARPASPSPPVTRPSETRTSSLTAPTRSPATAPPPGPPPLVFLADSGGGALPTLYRSRPGRPSVLDVLLLPPGAWRPGAGLGRDGTILLAEARRALVGRIDDDRVVPLWDRVIEPGEVGSEAPLGPACLADASLAAVFADGFYLVRPAGTVTPAATYGTRGDCAMADPTELLFETEEAHRLAAQAVGSAAVRISSSTCMDMAAGLALVACREPLAGADQAVVWERLAIEDGRPALGQSIARIAAGKGATIAALAITHDGGWLALLEERPGPTGRDRRLRLFERAGSGFEERDPVTVAAGLLLVGFAETAAPAEPAR